MAVQRKFFKMQSTSGRIDLTKPYHILRPLVNYIFVQFIMIFFLFFVELFSEHEKEGNALDIKAFTLFFTYHLNIVFIREASRLQILPDLLDILHLHLLLNLIHDLIAAHTGDLGLAGIHPDITDKAQDSQGQPEKEGILWVCILLVVI